MVSSEKPRLTALSKLFVCDLRIGFNTKFRCSGCGRNGSRAVCCPSVFQPLGRNLESFPEGGGDPGHGAGAAAVSLAGVCQSLHLIYVASFKPNENPVKPP